MTDSRYSLQDLALAMGVSIGQVPSLVGIGGPEYVKYRDQGMPREVAERKALKAGLPAYSVWPEMVDHDIEEMSVTCAAEDCDNRFMPYRKTHKYCSKRCKKRVDMRRVRASEKGREAQRAANRKYYAECRDYILAQQRKYDHAHRDQITARRRANRQASSERKAA